MKTPESRTRFHAANRHYHRHRGETRGWDDWISPERKTRSRRGWWVAAGISLTVASAVLLFAFDLL